MPSGYSCGRSISATRLDALRPKGQRRPAFYPRARPPQRREDRRRRARVAGQAAAARSPDSPSSRPGSAEEKSLAERTAELGEAFATARSSMPSATTATPSAAPRRTTASTTADRRRRRASRTTNDRSILSSSIGRVRRLPERREAGPEVVERDADAGGAEDPEVLDALLAAVEHDALGDLEVEGVGREAGVAQGTEDVLDEVRVAQLAGRDVHAQPEVRWPRHSTAAGRRRRDRPCGAPSAEGDDQAAVLGARDEDERRHVAADGMVPAGERLDARRCGRPASDTIGW